MKKEYVKPTMEVYPMKGSAQLLAGSVTVNSVEAPGLEPNDELEFILNPQSLWDTAQ